MFTNEDIENLKLIYYLLKDRGMTIKGAQKKLKDNKADTIQNFEVVSKLQEIKQMLIEIKNEL
jgi:DNA-binding transcriptional MerR regulator